MCVGGGGMQERFRSKISKRLENRTKNNPAFCIESSRSRSRAIDCFEFRFKMAATVSLSPRFPTLVIIPTAVGQGRKKRANSNNALRL